MKNQIDVDFITLVICCTAILIVAIVAGCAPVATQPAVQTPALAYCQNTAPEQRLLLRTLVNVALAEKGEAMAPDFCATIAGLQDGYTFGELTEAYCAAGPEARKTIAVLLGAKFTDAGQPLSDAVCVPDPQQASP